MEFADGITQWHEVVFSFLTPPNTSAVKVMLRSSTIDADCAWDDVALIKKEDANLVNYGTLEYGMGMRGANYVTSTADPKNVNNTVAAYTGTSSSPAQGKYFDDIFLLGGRNYVFEFDFYADSIKDSNTPTTVNPRMTVITNLAYKTDGTTYGGAWKQLL